MRIRIFWVGKTKEQYLTEGIHRYLALLAHFVKITVIEIKEEKGKERNIRLAAEGKRILRHTESFVLLDERGVEVTSIEFARFLSNETTIDFVLGGPYGVSQEVREKAKSIIALSKMTFTHEMARIIFLEQLYRGITIMKGKEYHH